MTEFKLLLLPPEAQRNVLRTMGYGQLIGFSLCSKSTKRQTIALKYTDKYMSLTWGNNETRLELYLDYKRQLEFLKATFENPNCLKLFERNRERFGMNYVTAGEFQKDNFEMKNWIAHLASVFHIKNISQVQVFKSENHVESIKNGIGSMDFITLNIALRDNEYTENLVKELIPKENIIKKCRSFQCGSKVLAQNLKVLHVLHSQFWKLNDLLILNAKYAYLHNTTLKSTDLNRFLKLWMKGSNHRLVCLECEAAQGNYDEDEVKRGIKGEEIPEDTSRTFDKHTLDFKVERQEVRGGFDIRRIDGSLATVFFEGLLSFNFVVW